MKREHKKRNRVWIDLDANPDIARAVAKLEKASPRPGRSDIAAHLIRLGMGKAKS